MCYYVLKIKVCYFPIMMDVCFVISLAEKRKTENIKEYSRNKRSNILILLVLTSYKIGSCPPNMLVHLGH